MAAHTQSPSLAEQVEQLQVRFDAFVQRIDKRIEETDRAALVMQMAGGDPSPRPARPPRPRRDRHGLHIVPAVVAAALLLAFRPVPLSCAHGPGAQRAGAAAASGQRPARSRRPAGGGCSVQAEGGHDAWTSSAR